MGRFDSIPDIKGKLEDFEIQCVMDFWGDPVRNMLDQSIEEDAFEPYKKGEYYHSLIRLETYISLARATMAETPPNFDELMEKLEGAAKTLLFTIDVLKDGEKITLNLALKWQKKN